MKIINFIYCMAYGFMLGTVMGAIPMLLLQKLQTQPSSNIIQGLTGLSLVLVSQLFYVKTYKWLIYDK